MDINDDLVALRARVHKLSDLVQGHEGDLREHKTVLQQHGRQLDTMTAQMATREQLTNAVTGMSERLDRFHGENSLKLQNVELKLTGIADSINPIRSGIMRLVWLIIAAIVAAVLGAILVKPTLPATPVLSPAPIVTPQSP